jgi:hypothetical protein
MFFHFGFAPVFPAMQPEDLIHTRIAKCWCLPHPFVKRNAPFSRGAFFFWFVVHGSWFMVKPTKKVVFSAFAMNHEP